MALERFVVVLLLCLLGSSGAEHCQGLGTGNVSLSQHCVLRYSFKICSVKDQELGAHVTRLRGNLWGQALGPNSTFQLLNYTSFTNCWRSVAAFVTITSFEPDSRSAVDCDKTFNTTDGNADYSCEAFYNPAQPRRNLTARLFVGGETAAKNLHFQERVAFVLPLPSHPPPPAATTNVESAETCSDAASVLTGGAWIRDPGFPRFEDVKDDGGDAWSWQPATCIRPSVNLISSDVLTKKIVQKNLTDLVLIGSARTRTLFYDIITKFSPFEETKPDAANNQKHFFPALNLTLYFHLLDCAVDVNRGTRVLTGYTNTINAIQLFLQGHALCSFAATENCGATTKKRKQIVVFSTGFCEADRTCRPYYNKHLPFLMNYLEAECNSHRRHHHHQHQHQHEHQHHDNHCANTDSLLVVKAEESVDPSVRFFSQLGDFSHLLQQLAANSSLPFFDAYHISRAYKAFNDSHDLLHFNSLRGAPGGNRASRTIAGYLVDFVLSSALTVPTARIPYTKLVSATDGDGTLISYADNRRQKTIYWMLNNTKHPIPSWETFVKLRLSEDLNEVLPLHEADFKATPIGEPLAEV